MYRATTVRPNNNVRLWEDELGSSQWACVLAFVAISRGRASSPRLPPGYSLRAVAGLEEARAKLHLAAFPHGHISGELYARLIKSRHYRADLDIVTVAPEGGLASMALAWFDVRNKTGELEPVGTHPAHRQRGLDF
jgi:hypothetical protein